MSTPVSPVAVDLLTKQLAHEIGEQRNMIALRLHSVFLYMVEALESCRKHWQEAGAVTYQAAAEVGWNPRPPNGFDHARSFSTLGYGGTFPTACACTPFRATWNSPPRRTNGPGGRNRCKA